MKMISVFLAAVMVSLLAFANVGMAQDNGPNLDSYIESLRADLRADKVAIITQTMNFTDQEAKVFWPVYRKYEADLAKVNDQRVALIKSYAQKFPSISDADAKTMITQSLDFESSRVDLKKKYAKEFQKAGLSSLTTAKFFQLEHRLDLLVDIQIAADLPSLLSQPVSGSATKQ
jgi:hypothetical protein